MALTRSALLILGASAFVLAPALSPDLPGAYGFNDQAFAKNGNGNGNGNGNSGGNANGNSGGNGNGGNSAGNGNSGNAASSGSGGKGLGLFKRGNSKTKQARSSNGNGKGLGGFLNNVFGGNKKAGNSGSRRQTASRGGTKSQSHRLPKAERATLAAVSVTPLASPNVKQKNFNAKLGRLNSLKRNYRAYINSNSPHLASIVAYIDATLTYDSLAAELAIAEENLDSARVLLAETLDVITPYDEFAYEDLSSEELEARLAELEGIDDTELPLEQAAALQAERTALAEALESDAYTAFTEAETAYNNQEADLDDAGEATSDEALREALVAMANENRIREYGEDYVDDEMLDWAKEILGVGDFYGKIDEIREFEEASEDDDVAEAPDPSEGTGETGDRYINPLKLRLKPSEISG